MARQIQVVIDCADPGRLTKFWASALGYVPQEPPEGFSDWRSFWQSIGLPEDEIVDSSDAVVDPDGIGPRIWFLPALTRRRSRRT